MHSVSSLLVTNSGCSVSTGNCSVTNNSTVTNSLCSVINSLYVNEHILLIYHPKCKASVSLLNEPFFQQILSIEEPCSQLFKPKKTPSIYHLKNGTFAQYKKPLNTTWIQQWIQANKTFTDIPKEYSLLDHWQTQLFYSVL